MDIEIKNVSKSFDKKPIIKDISLSIKSGEIICLLGPSGAGKTTLIRLILGAIKGERGEIHIGNIKVPNLELLSKIGYMPQNNALYEDLSATENIKFFAGLYRIPSNKINEIEDEILSVVGLQEDKKKLVSKFSGGMKKRLSLAIAILNKPDILLLDEPTVGIDPVLRRNIWKEFKKLKEEGRTLIVSTHVMDEVKNCDKAALISNGELILFDTIPNLLAMTNTGEIEDLFFTTEKVGGESI